MVLTREDVRVTVAGLLVGLTLMTGVGATEVATGHVHPPITPAEAAFVRDLAGGL